MKEDLLGQVDINNFLWLIPALTNYFTSRAECFKAVQLLDYVDNWKLTTSDQEILAMVQGQYIEFLSISFQKELPVQSFKQSEIVVINTEVEKLLHKGVIIATGHKKGKFICPIVLRSPPPPKKNWLFQGNPPSITT